MSEPLNNAFVLYATDSKCLELPRTLLDLERMKYEVILVRPADLVVHSKGRLAIGWAFCYKDDSAVCWKSLYRLLDRHGLLLC